MTETTPAAPVAPVAAPAAPTPGAGVPSIPAPAAPDYSKLVAPKDSGYAPEFVAKHGEWAKGKGVSVEHAQEVLGLLHERDRGAQAAFNAEAAKWIDTLKADPNFGGSKFDASVKNRDAFLDRFATTPELKAAVKEFKESAWVNHPLFATLFSAAGSLFAEKPAVQGAPAAKQHMSYAEAFPETYKQMTPAQRKQAGFE